jgi:uncharacterized protein with HEPN domain
MFDKALASEVLRQILTSVETIIARCDSIITVNDFTDSPAGMEKLDSICMQLIVIGESLKNFDKITDTAVLCHYPEIDWRKVKGLRDIITHHYADINADAIFETCKNKIPELKQVLEKILNDPSLK